MKKRWFALSAVSLLSVISIGYFHEKTKTAEEYAHYVHETYGEEVEMEMSRDWKPGSYKGTFELKQSALAGTYYAESRSDGTIRDNVTETVWQREAETIITSRLKDSRLLFDEESLQAEVPIGSSKETSSPNPPSIFDADSHKFLRVSVMFHEKWSNTDEQKQRVLGVIHALNDDVYSIHFSFDETPGEDDDFRERYMAFSQKSSDGEPTLKDLQTIEDLNAYDRLYGFDQATFIKEYHFDGTVYK